MFKILLTDDAARDLEKLYFYICKHDSVERADYVLQKLEAALTSLSEMPNRGTTVKELTTLGITEYREIFFKPYRIIYRVISKRVYVYLITDGRRDMRTMLSNRLLDA